MKNNRLKRNIISITRMTIHNGPGLRTLVLFKGCPLRCMWCSTPESQKMEPELGVFPDKCIHCGTCISNCPNNAIRLTEKTLIIDRNLCNNCGECTKVCCAGALKIYGQSVTAEEVIEEVKKDLPFFKKSHGGVTLSGGEPLTELDFNLNLLPGLKEEGITVGMDTSGYVSWDHIEPLLPYIDFFLWDIKHMDPEKHQKLTGVPNNLILKNARSTAQHNVPIYLRIPVVPGYNDSEENLRDTFEFAKTLPSLVEVHLLPLHHLGKSRYSSVNRDYPAEKLTSVPEEVLLGYKKYCESWNLKCLIVG